MPLALRADGLVKRFGATVALDGLDLEAEEGRVLGVLGPNGAGKTTAVRILATLPLPMSRSAVIGGRVLADVARLMLTTTIMVTVGVLIGWRPELQPLRLIGALALALSFGQAMSWLASLVGLNVKSAEAAQAASFLGIFPLTFASSVFVPVQFMPGWLQAFARANPITLIASTIRALTHGDPLGQTWWQASVWLVALTAVASVAATRKYKQPAS